MQGVLLMATEYCLLSGRIMLTLYCWTLHFLTVTALNYAVLLKQHPHLHLCLMLNNRSELSIVMQSLQNGASGYLLKNASLEELSNCIKQVTTGILFFVMKLR